MKNKNNNSKNMIIVVIVIVILLVFLISIVLNYLEDKKYHEEEQKALDRITFDVPKKFEKSAYGSSKDYSYYDGDTSCSINVDVTENDYYLKYENGQDYLEDRIYITLKDKVSEIKEVKINNYIWYYMSVENDKNITHYYATIKDDTIYELEYRITDYKKGDGSNDYCLKQYDEIIASVKLK